VRFLPVQIADVGLEVAPKEIWTFDIECRPLGWFGGVFVHSEITAIAWGRILPGSSKVRNIVVKLLGIHTTEEMLEEFEAMYLRADMLTGHFIRGFDLGNINGARLEFGMKPLPAKLTHDTKIDLMKFSGLSKSQENLGSILDTYAPKVTMNMGSWRKGNRLDEDGIKLIEKRARGDIRQQAELRRRLLDQGFLSPPKIWSSYSSGANKGYTA
jgi:hypothetical protein